MAKYALIYPLGIFREVKFYREIKHEPSDIAQLFIHGYGHNSTAWKSWKKTIQKHNLNNAHTINLHRMFISDLSKFSKQVKERIAEIIVESVVAIASP